MRVLVVAMIAVIAAGAFFALKVKPPEVPVEKVMTKIVLVDDEFALVPTVESLNLNKRKVALGDELFHDRILSKNETISCASCHILAAGGDDNRAHSVGINGIVTAINTPTVFNSSLNFKQFWDGRADTLEEQVAGPLHNPSEMGLNWEEAILRLNKNASYKKKFEEVYTDGITEVNIADAIAEFERSLVTPNSSFDKFLQGDDKALDDVEKAGYLLFKSLGCVSCHNGAGIGGGMFQRMGAKRSYFEEGNTNELDFGRFNVTKKEADRYRFKVPSLRNIALTAPYFHNGSAKTLKDAVQVMARHQLARRLSEDEETKLVAFLRSLTGEYQGESLSRDGDDVK